MEVAIDHLSNQRGAYRPGHGGAALGQDFIEPVGAHLRHGRQQKFRARVVGRREHVRGGVGATILPFNITAILLAMRFTMPRSWVMNR